MHKLHPYQLPSCVWLHIHPYINNPTPYIYPYTFHVLLILRQLDHAWCQWIRDCVRTYLCTPKRWVMPPTIFKGHFAWPLAQWKPHIDIRDAERLCHDVWRLAASLPHVQPNYVRKWEEYTCLACGSHSRIKLPTTRIQWHVVAFGFGTGVRTITNKSQVVRLCSSCYTRCTISWTEATTILMSAAVDEYTLKTRPYQSVEPLPHIVAPGQRLHVVVLLSENCRYMRADVDLMVMHSTWGSPSIERTDFTTHRRAIVWNTIFARQDDVVYK